MNQTQTTDHQQFDYETILWIFLYSVVAFLSFVGNTLLALVLLVENYMSTVTNCFIFNLAIADALTGVLIIPFKFQAVLLQAWHLPHFLCHVIPFSETVTLSVSVISLTFIAVDRFLTVIFPTAERMGLRGTKIALPTIWVFSVLISVPYGIGHEIISRFNGTQNTSQQLCWPRWENFTSWKVYNINLTICQYFVPVFIVNIAYLCIAWKVWVTQHEALEIDGPEIDFDKAKRRVVKMLIIVDLLFTFCWLPLETYYVLAEVRPDINLYKNIKVIFFCCHWLAMTNSALNPIIYGIYNKKIRKGYRTLIFNCGLAHWVRSVFRRSRQQKRSLRFRPEIELISNLDRSAICRNYIAAELGRT